MRRLLVNWRYVTMFALFLAGLALAVALVFVTFEHKDMSNMLMKFHGVECASDRAPLDWLRECTAHRPLDDCRRDLVAIYCGGVQ